MAQDLEHNRPIVQRHGLANAGTKRTIREGDLDDGTTLHESQEITIWSKQLPADKVYAHGAGSDDRQRGRDSFIYAKLHATGSGAGAADDAITGDLVAVVTDSEQRDVHARYELGDLTSLADAEAESMTDRPMQPVVVPIAREDQHIELRVIADSNSDGVEVDDGGDQSTVARLYYTDISV
jgi:hypothetical protein